LAVLGFKDEALSHLKEIEKKYLKEMSPSARENFLSSLKQIETC
jgi:hypothetical protein